MGGRQGGRHESNVAIDASHQRDGASGSEAPISRVVDPLGSHNVPAESKYPYESLRQAGTPPSDIRRLAVAAQRDLTAQVEHCPEWTVLDLVAHIAGVQWFWATIVEGKVQDREHLQRPGGIPANGDPIDWFRAQTMRLHNALSTSVDTDPVWTWWPDDQSVGLC